MSETRSTDFDLRAHIVRIDRDIAKTRKLLTEVRIPGNDTWLIVLGAVLAGVVARLPEILQAFGMRGCR